MRTRIQIPIENTITRSIITNRKTVKKREREAKHCNICGTDKREQKGESKNLLFMSTSAFLQTILAKRRPIPLMEVRANMIFCFPSTFVLSTRSMCWNSSFATKDWHRQIKKHVNQTWEREKEVQIQTQIESLTMVRVSDEALRSCSSQTASKRREIEGDWNPRLPVKV